jgi:DNA-binding MurR/RpiR family transcriptional regulator
MKEDERVALIARLRSAGSGMTPALERVALRVLAGPDEVLYFTITELADAANSSEASVMRFCRELGFSGFQDFKLELAKEIATTPAAAPANQNADAVQSLVETAIKALRETEQLVDRHDLGLAAERVLRASQVNVFGVAASAVTADYLEYKLTRVGIRCRALSDPHLASMLAATADPSMVYFIVSSSGSTTDTVNVARQARQSGAFVIGITNRSKSPLVTNCNLTLVASWPETPLTGGAFPSKISQLLLVDALLAYITTAAPERIDTIKRTAGSVSDRSY